jgi:hypothetical protein
MPASRLLLPPILPDEHLLGFMVRVCRLNSIDSLASLKRETFAIHAAVRGENAFRLMTFFSAGCLLASKPPRSLLLENTVFPRSFAVHRSPTIGRVSNGESRRYLSLPGQQARFCASCLRSDQATVGIGYLRCEHNRSSDDNCVRHREMLISRSVPDAGSGRDSELFEALDTSRMVSVNDSTSGQRSRASILERRRA